MAPPGTSVSLLSSSTSSLDVARMPMLLATEKPRFAPASITWTSGQRSRTIRGLPSSDALSTTITWCGVAGGAAASESSVRARSSRVL
jgi:hypothetical protein